MWLWIWLAIAVIAGIGEAFTYDLFLASVAVAAVIVAVLSLFLAWPIAIGVFAALSLVGITMIRPTVKHALGIDSLAQPVTRVRHTHVVGRRAEVTQAITQDSGQIRIGQGEFWTARSYEPDQHIEPGKSVEVVMVEGLTALVEPVRTEAEAAETATNTLIEKGS